ncbi:MAG: hypothetical protein AAGB00_05845, partial [Planctomycetota bacterium]
MNHRERNLAIGVAVLIGGWAASVGWGAYQRALDRRSSAVIDAELSLDTARVREEQVRKLVLEDLAGYQARSLPADPQVAQQAYRGWLIDQLEAAGLDFADVKLTERRPRGEAYTSLGYSANAEGGLAEVTRFLHGFYASPMLHKLTLLKLTPRDRGRLQMNVQVRALAVRGADLTEGVPAGESARPLLGGVDAYLA